MIVTAKTGSGKTAAFVLPLITRLLTMSRGKVDGLILCPTREVAQQTQREVERFSRGTGLRSVAIYGGVPIEPQIRSLRAGVDVVVATPGRLLDHLQRRTIALSGVAVLVLDEADRMLDMGFLPDVSRIIASVAKNRQTLLFSATIPEEVVALADRFLTNPVRIAQDDQSKPPETLLQAVYPAVQEDKTRLLVSLLRGQSMSRVLVFARTKSRAERVAKQLARQGFRVAFIHGGRSQRQRDTALEGFRRGDCEVLVGTDVAARGLDVTGVTHVVNYDLPAEPGDYIHRVGRTARAGRSGRALSLVTKEDSHALRSIEEAIGHRIPRYQIVAD
jgi:ATP-dependent RNA helicase RhlE